MLDRNRAGRVRPLHQAPDAEVDPSSAFSSSAFVHAPAHRLRHGRRARGLLRARSASTGRGCSGPSSRRRVRRRAPAAPAINRDRRSTPGRRRAGGQDRIAQRAARCGAVKTKIWQAIESTPNFWTTLKPLDEGAVAPHPRADAAAPLGGLLHHAAAVHRGRNRAASDPALARRAGLRPAERARPAAAHAAPRPRRCASTITSTTARRTASTSSPTPTAKTDSRSSPSRTAAGIASARKLGIGIAHRIGDALDILDQATLAQTNPSLLQRESRRWWGGNRSRVVSRGRKSQSPVTVQEPEAQSSVRLYRTCAMLTVRLGHPIASNFRYFSIQHVSIQHCCVYQVTLRAEADDARRDDAADVVRRQRRRGGARARRRVERVLRSGGARGSRSSWSG